MWKPLRVWWYRRFVKPQDWPTDVRIHVFRDGVRGLEKLKDTLSPERQEELARREMLAALEDDSPAMDEMRAEVLADAMRRYAQIPAARCANCGLPVTVHEARKIEGRHYCKTCVSEGQAKS